MFEIFSQTDNKTIFTSLDSNVLETMLKAKINHIHVCGGNARCSTCRVDVMDGLTNCRPRNEKEKQLSGKLGFPQNIRLACQTRLSGNVIVGSFDTGMMSKISAIGDAVNLASRIETANKDFDTKLLISQWANEKIRGVVETRRKNRVKLKGKSGEYVLYAVEI